MHGHTLDPDGEKMSKSKGNFVSPEDVIEKHGRDALRFYTLQTTVWDDFRFSWNAVETAARDLQIVWNVFSFATLYMNLDKFNIKKWTTRKLAKSFHPEDKWLLSRTETLVRDVTQHMDKLEIHLAVRALGEFVIEDLSHWYIRLVRRRFWLEKTSPDKLAAYTVLRSEERRVGKECRNQRSPEISSRRRHTRCLSDWSSDVCSSDLRTETLVRDVTQHMDKLEIHLAVRALGEFVIEDLSHWYIRLVRRRFWLEKTSPDKLAAYTVLYHALRSWLGLAAPAMPFLTETIYREAFRSVELLNPESIHMTNWPSADTRWISKRLEEEMRIVQHISDATASARQSKKINLRQPVSTILIIADKTIVKRTAKTIRDLIL